MGSATLNIRVQPRRMLSVGDAAAYTGLTLRQFKAVCPLPPVEFPGGKKGYDIRDLDRWIDSLKADGFCDSEKIVGRLR